MDYLTNDTDLKKVADAIRAKAGVTDSLVFPDGFVSSISGIIMPTYTLVVKTSPSSAITVSKGTKTFSGTADASGECTFSLPEAGVWTVTIGTKTQTVIIGTQELEVKLTSEVFAENDWAQIIEACHSGNVPLSWVVGNSKPMTINNTDYTIDIIGKNHDTYTAGGTAPLTFQLHDCYLTNYRMNEGRTNSGGWNQSDMRGIYLPAILLLMPEEVQNGIRKVNKTTCSPGTKNLVTTSDNLFLLSESEIFSSIKYTLAKEGMRYEYYSTVSNSSIKQRDGSTTGWWERSAYTSTVNFCFVSYRGDGNYSSANNYNGVAFAFCF